MSNAPTRHNHYTAPLRPYRRRPSRLLRTLMLAAALLAAAAAHCSVTQPTVYTQSPGRRDAKEALQRLDRTLEHRTTYIDRRQWRADSLQRLASADTARRLDLSTRCIIQLEGLNADSALAMTNRTLALAYAQADSTAIQTLYALRALAEFNNGQMMESFADIRRLDSMHLTAGAARPCRYVCEMIFLILGADYQQKNVWSDYFDLALKHIEASQRLLSPSSALYQYNEALAQYARGELDLMAAQLHRALESRGEGFDAHAPYILTMLGEYYRTRGDRDAAIYYYAEASAANILQANLDAVALMRLGEVLYAVGDTDRAYDYLCVMLDNSVRGGMNFNLMRINDVFIKAGATVDRGKHRRMWTLCILVAVLIAALGLLIKSSLDRRRELQRLKVAESRLGAANLAKETYITEFMALCSGYIDSLEEYNRMSRRKIMAGQTDELLAIIKSGKTIDEQRKRFYQVFDAALLHIYPDYIEQVNRLLLPDRQIIPPSPGVLTTELRILALSRLGIDDAAKTARFLGISTNTIYTYRNKLRSRAVNRAAFEEDARRIGAV